VAGVQLCDSNLRSLRNCVLLTMHWPSGPNRLDFSGDCQGPVQSAVSDVHGTNLTFPRRVFGVLGLMLNVDSVTGEPPRIEVSMDAQDHDGAHEGDGFTARAS
jgi:hypothetical protein